MSKTAALRGQPLITLLLRFSQSNDKTIVVYDVIYG